MSEYSSLKATINANIKANNNHEITGAITNSVLNAMVDSLGAGYQFMGVATPQTNPGTPDPKVFYIASTAGTYSNFGGIVLADGEFAILCYNGNWNKVVTDAVTFKNFSLIKAGSELQNLDNFANGVFSLTCSGEISNLPADVDFRGGCLLFVIRRGNDTLRDWDRQVLLSINSPGYVYGRLYFRGQWQEWEKVSIEREIIQLGLIQNASINYDNLVCGIYGFTARNGTNIGLPTELLFGGGGILFVFRKSNTSLSDWDRQVLTATEQPGIVYSRVYFKGAWQQWGKRESGDATNIIECGVGKQYTTLRSAIAAAIQANGTKVIVYPGTYDLTQEFATELANHSGSGILLTNDVHVIFMPGAYVTCMVDVSNEWAYSNFEPFRVNGGNFTLENANINCKNTRYNVHDELGGSDAQYIHRYINCIMEHFDENPNAYYPQCIGGGLGSNGYIEVIGGKYKSTSLYYPSEHYSSPDDIQQPISYHNGNNASCDSKIVIKDVYLVDKGYLRFGNYGPSTILTPVFVSGCRMYKPVFLMNETWSPSQVQNFEVFSFNNEVVNP